MSDPQNQKIIDAKSVGFEYAEQSPSFGNDFIWSLLKSAALGAGAGLFFNSLHEAFKNNGRTINPHLRKLNYTTEGMEDQYVLCQHFLTLQKHYSKYNEEEYRASLARCSDLCTLARTLASDSVYKELHRKALDNTLDPYLDLTYDQQSRNTWFDISKSLHRLLLSVRMEEKVKFEERDKQERMYAKAKEDFQQAMMEWELLELEAQRMDREKRREKDDPMDFMSFMDDEPKSDDGPTHISLLPPKPTLPEKPEVIQMICKSDGCDRLVEFIKEHTLKISKYVESRVHALRTECVEGKHSKVK